MAFLPRHGRGHVHSPGSVPYRANIDALKRLGGDRRHLGLGLRLVPGGDGAGRFRRGRSVHRPHLRPREEFFSAKASSPMSRSRIPPARACRRPAPRPPTPRAPRCTRVAPISPWKGRSFLEPGGVEALPRGLGHCDVIGMTNMPEAKLAREAELCYASIRQWSPITTAWHPHHGRSISPTSSRRFRAMPRRRGAWWRGCPAFWVGRARPCPHGCGPGAR